MNLKYKDRGITLLETSILLVILSSFIFSIFVIVSFLQNHRFVQSLLNKELGATSFQPFYLENERLVLNTTKMQKYLDTLTQNIYEQARLKGKAYIEVYLASMPINSEHGYAVGHFEKVLQASLGNKNDITSSLLAKYDLNKLLLNYSTETTTYDGLSLLAIPLSNNYLGNIEVNDVNSYINNYGDNFISQAIVLAARLFIVPDNNAPYLYIQNTLELDTAFVATKIMPFRGNVDL